jgi:hypothetical protein
MIVPNVAGILLINEFRNRGPAGAQDEFVEIYNPSDVPFVVNSSDGIGFALVSADAPSTVKAVIPNGTSIPPHGHFLFANNTVSTGYSLSAYPSGYGGPFATTATPDATYGGDVLDNTGFALFSTATTTNFNLDHRIDAAGFSTDNPLFRVGTGIAPLNTAVLSDPTTPPEHSIFRALYGGAPKNTNNNVADFIYVDTRGLNPGQQRLGAPSPENLTSPLEVNAQFSVSLVDPGAAQAAGQNRVRNTTPTGDPNGTKGTLTFRRKFTNNTGAPIIRLRFRIIDISTIPAPAGAAILLGRTSANTSVSLTGGGSASVDGTTLEEPPVQPNGGGLNSSMSDGNITLNAPLAPGASVNVQFVFGVNQIGSFKFFFNLEAFEGFASTPQ